MNKRLYLFLATLLLSVKSYASEGSSGNLLRRLCAYCTSASQANARRLLQSMQSEEELIRERDKLSKKHRCAEKRLETAKWHCAQAKSEAFVAAAEKRIDLAKNHCLDTRKALDDFNKEHPGLPREEIKSKK